MPELRQNFMTKEWVVIATEPEGKQRQHGHVNRLPGQRQHQRAYEDIEAQAHEPLVLGSGIRQQQKGWPVGLAATPYALFRTIPVSRIAAHADWLDLVVGLAFAGWLIVVAARARARSDAPLQRFAVALAVILPLFAAPYLLLHDLLILIPAP